MANASHFNLLNCCTEHSIKCRRVVRSYGAAQILGSGVFKTRQTQSASCFESIEVPAVFQRLCYFLKPINSGTAPWAVEEGGWGYFDIAPIRHSVRELRSIYISIKSYIIYIPWIKSLPANNVMLMCCRDNMKWGMLMLVCGDNLSPRYHVLCR